MEDRSIYGLLCEEGRVGINIFDVEPDTLHLTEEGATPVPVGQKRIYVNPEGKDLSAVKQLVASAIQVARGKDPSTWYKIANCLYETPVEKFIFEDDLYVVLGEINGKKYAVVPEMFGRVLVFGNKNDKDARFGAFCSPSQIRVFEGISEYKPSDSLPWGTPIEEPEEFMGKYIPDNVRESLLLKPFWVDVKGDGDTLGPYCTKGQDILFLGYGDVIFSANKDRFTPTVHDEPLRLETVTGFLETACQKATEKPSIGEKSAVEIMVKDGYRYYAQDAFYLPVCPKGWGMFCAVNLVFKEPTSNPFGGRTNDR